MALEKNMILKNGIELKYHRIVSINNVTNITTVIDVASYISEEQRRRETKWKDVCERGNLDVYMINNVYYKDYTENFTIEDAYEYLLTLDEFKDAKKC
jgi:hypothetical protein